MVLCVKFVTVMLSVLFLMKIFHPKNSLAWFLAISIILNLIVFKFSQTSKNLMIPNVYIFFSRFTGCWVINSFMIFYLIFSYKTYLRHMLPPVGRKRQLIYPHCYAKCCHGIKKPHWCLHLLTTLSFQGQKVKIF